MIVINNLSQHVNHHLLLLNLSLKMVCIRQLSSCLVNLRQLRMFNGLQFLSLRSMIIDQTSLLTWFPLNKVIGMIKIKCNSNSPNKAISLHQPLPVLLINRKKLYDRPSIVVNSGLQILKFPQRNQKQRIMVTGKLYIPTYLIDILPKITTIRRFVPPTQHHQLLQHIQTVHPYRLQFLDTNTQIYRFVVSRWYQLWSQPFNHVLSLVQKLTYILSKWLPLFDHICLIRYRIHLEFVLLLVRLKLMSWQIFDERCAVT